MLKDVTGERFGRLVVLERRENTAQGQARWLCLCDCGQEKVVTGSTLRNGAIKSCGCLRKEVSSIQGKKARRHGDTVGGPTKEYSVWRHMRERCEKNSSRLYKYYGGRGVTVCYRWYKFENFLADMGRCPSSKHTLDRVDTNGPYSPDNCRWATQKEQQNNRRNNVRLSFQGKTQTMKVWAEEYGVKYATFKWRIYQGWSMARALGIG